jgi:hypothetical protein
MQRRHEKSSSTVCSRPHDERERLPRPNDARLFSPTSRPERARLELQATVISAAATVALAVVVVVVLPNRLPASQAASHRGRSLWRPLKNLVWTVACSTAGATAPPAPVLRTGVVAVAAVVVVAAAAVGTDPLLGVHLEAAGEGKRSDGSMPQRAVTRSHESTTLV